MRLENIKVGLHVKIISKTASRQNYDFEQFKHDIKNPVEHIPTGKVIDVGSDSVIEIRVDIANANYNFSADDLIPMDENDAFFLRYKEVT